MKREKDKKHCLKQRVPNHGRCRQRPGHTHTSGTSHLPPSSPHTPDPVTGVGITTPTPDAHSTVSFSTSIPLSSREGVEEGDTTQRINLRRVVLTPSRDVPLSRILLRRNRTTTTVEQDSLCNTRSFGYRKIINSRVNKDLFIYLGHRSIVRGKRMVRDTSHDLYVTRGTHVSYYPPRLCISEGQYPLPEEFDRKTRPITNDGLGRNGRGIILVFA